MISFIFFLYNILETNKIHWLDLDNGEGLYTGLLLLIVDFFLFALGLFIYSYFSKI